MKFPFKTHKPTAAVRQQVQDVFAFLEAHQAGVLATVDAEQRPCASVVYYAIGDGATFSFVTKRGTRKHANLQRNPHAMLVVYDAASRTMAQIAGTAEALGESEEGAHILTEMLKRYWQAADTGVPPITQLHAGQYVAYRLRPTHIQMTSYSARHGGHETVRLTP